MKIISLFQTYKIRLLLLAILGVFVAGCIPVALVAGGATIGGAVVYDKRSTKVIAQDRDTASRALRTVYDDPQLHDQAHITIATFNQIMLMAGQAPTQELRDHAYQLVADTSPRVKRIYNEITVEPPLSSSAIASDTWLTTKVKSAMLAEKGLSSSQIKVVTENKSVYLMGLVTRKQADLAADVASQVSGVTRVVKIFEYEQ